MNLPSDALVNYVLPNEASHVTWSLMIVIYPYITGLVAGAFVVSALYHVLKIQDFKPIANFALISALCFGLFAGVPLLFHLGQPQRAFNIYITPHTTSAMSLFGYAYGSYMVVLLLEIWFIYREFFIRRCNETRGIRRLPWYVLTLGVTSYHPDSVKLDHRVSTVLAGLGIPWACMLHGYVGFIFGSVKANPWWATPLQPIIFLTSAVVSGIAMLVVMYSVIMWTTGARYDYAMIKKLLTILWAFFLFDWALELLELAHIYYLNSHEWAFVGPLVTGPLRVSYFYGQIGLLSLAPVVLLAYVALSKRAAISMAVIGNLASLFILAQVLVMRFNVVIGGQLMSKAGRGYVEYHWDLYGREGIIAVVAIFTCPFIVYFILSRFIPILEDGDGVGTRAPAAAGDYGMSAKRLPSEP